MNANLQPIVNASGWLIGLAMFLAFIGWLVWFIIKSDERTAHLNEREAEIKRWEEERKPRIELRP